MIKLHFNKKINCFNVFLFKKYLFVIKNDNLGLNFINCSSSYYSYFYLLKILRSFGLVISFKNLKDFF